MSNLATESFPACWLVNCDSVAKLLKQITQLSEPAFSLIDKQKLIRELNTLRCHSLLRHKHPFKHPFKKGDATLQ